jgi:hypothetical protein
MRLAKFGWMAVAGFLPACHPADPQKAAVPQQHKQQQHTTATELFCAGAVCSQQNLQGFPAPHANNAAIGLLLHSCNRHKLATAAMVDKSCVIHTQVMNLRHKRDYKRS